MKVCRICKKEYDDSVAKCTCGSTMFKQVNNASAGSSEYDRIKSELVRKRKNRSYIIAGIAIVIIALIISGIVKITNFANDPQRDIDANANEQYEQAVEYLKAGDYDSALKKLDEIDSSWSDYDKVYDKRAEAIKGVLQVQIDKYLADEDYEGLLKFLNKYSDEVNGDKELTATYNDVSKKYVEKVLVEADTFVSGSDYESAVKTLTVADNLVGGSTKITAKLEEIYEKYKDETLAKAEKLASKRKFQDAIDVIQTAQELYNCSEFEAALDGYAECLPKNIINCYEISSNGADIGHFTDSFGRTHSDALRIQPELYQDSYVEFNLDGKFDKLSGTIVTEKSKYSDALEFSIKIYADDELIYTSPSIYYTSEISFDINVKGKKIVKFEYDFDDDSCYAGTGIIDATVS